MLVLSRRLGEKVCIGTDITLTVVEIKGSRVRIGIEAPDQMSILREELVDSLDDAGRAFTPADQACHAANLVGSL